LQTRGYEFVVATLKDYFDLPEEDDFQGIPVYRFPFWMALSKGNVEQLMKLRRRVFDLKRSFAPDLIHINFLGSSVLFHFQTIQAHPAPLLVSMDSALPNNELGSDSLAGRTLRSADWVTCVSEAKLSQIRQLVPEIAPRSSFIYQGRKPPSLPPEPLPIEAPRLLCLGRLVRIKGFDLMLTALASIADRFPQARLVIAGDGPERSELERQIAELGLQAVVDMVGWVHPDEVPALMNTATLVVLPSRSEGLPQVAMEAGLMARPVAATRVGGLPEVIAHQQTGLLVEPENSAALAEAIMFLLGRPDESIRMGQAARLRVQEVFSWDRYVDAYDALYRKLVADWCQRY
jgi:glycogen(starch) synthase